MLTLFDSVVPLVRCRSAEADDPLSEVEPLRLVEANLWLVSVSLYNASGLEGSVIGFLESVCGLGGPVMGFLEAVCELEAPVIGFFEAVCIFLELLLVLVDGLVVARGLEGKLLPALLRL